MSQKAVRFNLPELPMHIPDLTRIDASRHLLIAGPTASGKSALALAVAQAQGGLIVNADALQIWSCWRAPLPRTKWRRHMRCMDMSDRIAAIRSATGCARCVD